MELTASRRPFIYFPLQHHFEQNFHVRHRLERYNAGRRMLFADATPETITEAIEEELRRPLAYRAVESTGASTAARLIADVL
jgi:UDP-N-acetylglucosamine:LPS N-acetylglucosamine transferase